MLEGGTNGGWLTKVCGSKMKRALGNMLKNAKFVARGLAGTIVMTAVTSFITALANSVVELSECHRQLITQVTSALEGIAMMYDAMSFLNLSGVGAVLLYATLPLVVYPVVALTTTGLQQCNTSARSISNYSLRSFSISSYANKKKECDPCKTKKKGAKKDECDPCKKKKTRGYANEKITVECLLKKIKKRNGLGITSELYRWVSKLNDKQDTVLVQKINNLGSKSKYWKRLSSNLDNNKDLKTLLKTTPRAVDTWKYVANIKTDAKGKLTADATSLKVIHRQINDKGLMKKIDKTKYDKIIKKYPGKCNGCNPGAERFKYLQSHDKMLADLEVFAKNHYQINNYAKVISEFSGSSGMDKLVGAEFVVRIAKNENIKYFEFKYLGNADNTADFVLKNHNNTYIDGKGWGMSSIDLIPAKDVKQLARYFKSENDFEIWFDYARFKASSNPMSKAQAVTHIKKKYRELFEKEAKAQEFYNYITDDDENKELFNKLFGVDNVDDFIDVVVPNLNNKLYNFIKVK